MSDYKTYKTTYPVIKYYGNLSFGSHIRSYYHYSRDRIDKMIIIKPCDNYFDLSEKNIDVYVSDSILLLTIDKISQAELCGEKGLDPDYYYIILVDSDMPGSHKQGITRYWYDFDRISLSCDADVWIASDEIYETGQ